MSIYLNQEKSCIFLCSLHISMRLWDVGYAMGYPLDTGSKLNAQNVTAQKMKFSIRYFFSKCDQIPSFLRVWSHLLKKSLMEKFIFCAEHVLNVVCTFNLFPVSRGCVKQI